MSPTSFVLDIPLLPPRIVALPVRTPLVKPGDDLPALLCECLRGLLRSDDVICVSETAVAISQGRSIPAETIRPSRLARLLAQRAGSYATVSQPESMQLVLESAGTLRVLAAAAAGAAGRLVGRRGDFYRLLGSAVAEIDGYTGTMPPYERHIVLGPPQSTHRRTNDRTGLRCSCLRRRRKRFGQGGSARGKRRSPHRDRTPLSFVESSGQRG